MKIQNRSPEIASIEPVVAARPQPVSRDSGAHRLTDETSQRSDQVEISAEARTRAAAASSDEPSLSAERIAELRQRLASGAYDSDEVIDALAPRLLDHGAL